MTTRPTIIAGAVATALLMSPAFAQSASDGTTASAGAVSPDGFDVTYVPLNGFAEAFVRTEDGRASIAYDAIQSSGGSFVQQYADYLSAVPVDQLTHEQELTYWLNVHNFILVTKIADRPRRSNTSYLWTSDGSLGELWSETAFSVAGHSKSLAQIQSRILELANGNADVIYGMYLGVEGAPSWRSRGYAPDRVYEQLASDAREFINSNTGIRTGRNEVQVSQFYNQYKNTVFNGSDDELRQHLAVHATGRRADRLADGEIVSQRRFDDGLDALVIRRAPSSSQSGGSSQGFGS